MTTSTTSRLPKAVARAASVLLALLAWQIAATALGESVLLPTPVATAIRLGQLMVTPDFWLSVGYSLLRITAGYMAALLLGIVLAATAGRFAWVETLLWPYMAFVKATPVASFIILCLIWMNSSFLSGFISFLMVLPIIYTNILEGIRSTDVKLLEMASLFRVPVRRKITHIYVPQVRPFLLSACGVSVGLAWKAGVAAEVIGIPKGSIGERLYEAKIYFSSADLFAWTVVIVAVSVLFEHVLTRFLNARRKKVS